MDKLSFYQDLYSGNLRILRHIGSHVQSTEDGHSLLYILNGISRYTPEERFSLLQQEENKIAHILHIPEKVSILRTEYSLPVPTHKKSSYVFEGYGINPQQEHSSLIEQWSNSSQTDVCQIPPSVSRYWLSKDTFRQEVKEVYTDDALPYGERLSGYSQAQVLNSIISQLQKYDELILKKPGAGGGGNLCLSSDMAIINIADKVTDFTTEKPEWLILEEWVNWKYSYCVSFFVVNQDTYFWLEMCQQILNTSQFIGSHSLDVLHPEDKKVIIDYLSPLVKRMADTGVRGFVGIDIILHSSHDSGCTLPHSQLQVSFIETNPRLNGHNQNRLFMSYLALRDGLHPEEVQDMRVSVSQTWKQQFSTKEEVVQAVKMLCHGKAQEVSSKPLTPHQVYFYLDCCYTWNSIYDAIIFFGYGNVQDQIRSLYILLQAQQIIL